MGCATKNMSAKRCAKAKGCVRSETNTQAVNQIPKNQLGIVHFPHGGNEYPFRTPSRSSKNSNHSGYEVYWNCTRNHYRRLVKICRGAYIDSDRRYHEIANEELCVWTEWESLTHADELPLSSNQFDAKFIHQPKYPVSVAGAAKDPGRYYGKGKPSDALNTDPCIFGRTFKYAICRQGHDSWMRKLAQNSLILFWSHKGDSVCLDTVFVVGKNPVDYITGSTSMIKCSQEYRNLTLDRLGTGSAATFYRGISYNKSNPPLVYSFAPAIVFRESVNCARRCELNAKDIAQLNEVIGADRPFINVNAHRRSKSICASSDKIKSVWDTLTDIVMGKGFVLGVHFDWPKANKRGLTTKGECHEER